MGEIKNVDVNIKKRIGEIHWSIVEFLVYNYVKFFDGNVCFVFPNDKNMY